ncbi:MAG: hypothetical protein JO122_12055 [Acetobacteraceae bacterium]|nr:hypothetical protein [Acetobacteraceae bacterium]
MTKRVLAAAACIISSQVLAQAAPPPPPPDIQRLEQMSAERNALIHRSPMPPPHANMRQVIRQTDHLWVCMGTAPWQPVYSSPRFDSPTIGKTLPQVAVNGGWVNGFALVLHYNGKIGYIPASAVHPYQSQVKPNGTCSVDGVRLDGSPVFGFH